MRLSIFLLFIFVAVTVVAQSNNQFTFMEINHVRAATPKIFSKRDHINLRFDTLFMHDYAFPLPASHLISGYCIRGRRNHCGVDIKTHAKDTIRAAFDGIVRMSKPYGGYGEVIVVRHPNGIETLYSHNFKNFVSSGDTVKAGEPIALTGRTGKASTEHLHFEVRINGQAIDPNIFYNFSTCELKRKRFVCTKTSNGVRVKEYVK